MLKHSYSNPKLSKRLRSPTPSDDEDETFGLRVQPALIHEVEERKEWLEVKNLETQQELRNLGRKAIAEESAELNFFAAMDSSYNRWGDSISSTAPRSINMSLD